MTVRLQHLLVPLDLSPASDPVAAHASELARRLGARVTALYVVEESEALRGLNLPTVNYDEVMPELEARARAKLSAYLKEHLPGADPIVAHGEPYQRILDLTQHLPADLLVMGTHGRRGLDRGLFGSTAERVIRRSAVAVVVVPVLE